MSAYRPVLAENDLYLIRDPTGAIAQIKHAKSVQLQHFFCWDPHVGAPPLAKTRIEGHVLPVDEAKVLSDSDLANCWHDR